MKTRVLYFVNNLLGFCSAALAGADCPAPPPEPKPKYGPPQS